MENDELTYHVSDYLFGLLMLSALFGVLAYYLGVWAVIGLAGVVSVVVIIIESFVLWIDSEGDWWDY